MNISQLQYFCAVCNCGTVSEAAKTLHISQPSVSDAIKELEKEFKTALFVRRHRGMELTPDGETLFNMSKKLVNDFEQIKKVMTERGSGQKVLKLGVPPMIGSVMLPEIFAAFCPQHPDITLSITEGGSSELSSKLNDGYLDALLLPTSDMTDSRIISSSVAEFKIVCCAKRNGILKQFESGKGEISPKQLANAGLVLFSDGFYQTELIKKWFASENCKPEIILQTDQLSTIQSVIESGLAVGFLFDKIVEKNSNLVSFPTHMSINVNLCVRKGGYISESLKSFASHLKKQAVPAPSSRA